MAQNGQIFLIDWRAAQDETANWLIWVSTQSYEAPQPRDTVGLCLWEALESAADPLSTRGLLNILRRGRPFDRRLESAISRRIHRMYGSGLLLGYHTAGEPTRWRLLVKRQSWRAEFGLRWPTD